MQITQLLNSNCFPGVNKPRFVLLHGTAGGTSAEAIAQYFQAAGVSAHYVIGVDGEIWQCNNEPDGAWADGIIDGIPVAGLPFRTQSDGVHRDDWWDPNGINPNDQGIAIEHCKPHDDNSDALTPAQQASSFWLVNDICNRWSIPKRFADANGGITGHFSIAAQSRQRCPGLYPWQDLFNYLNGGQQPMSNIPQGWSDDGHTLYAPDKKFPIVLGFRGFILNPDNKWDPNDYPIEAEHGANPVEMSNVGLGAGSEQTYRMSRLGYAQGKIYKTWIGQELLWYQKQYDLLQAQLTQLLAANADLHEKLAELQADALAQQNAALQAKIEQAVKDLS